MTGAPVDFFRKYKEKKGRKTEILMHITGRKETAERCHRVISQMFLKGGLDVNKVIPVPNKYFKSKPGPSDKPHRLCWLEQPTSTLVSVWQIATYSLWKSFCCLKYW